jgi:hypothetical protein
VTHRAITYVLLFRDTGCKVLYEPVAEEARISLQRVCVLVLTGECVDQAVSRTVRNVTQNRLTAETCDFCNFRIFKRVVKY